jgi:hypothetical protein
VRRLPALVATLGVAALAAGACSGTASAATPPVRTLAGAGAAGVALSAPGGLALDAAGDLFVADTGHCRVVVVPAHDEAFDGLHLRAGRGATLVGGTCRGADSLGHPSGVAVDAGGDVFVAEATAQRVQVVRASSHAVAVTYAGTGHAGFSGDGLPAAASALDEPTGVAVDAAGDLFIADTANCRVRVVPARSGSVFGRSLTSGQLSTVAGTGVCGSAGQGGPVTAAQLSNPVAVAFDAGGDLLVADAGDQSVLLAPQHGGTYFGTAVGPGDIGVVLGGTGTYGPYLTDGLAATGVTAELNDPRGVAVGPGGDLFVTDGFMHVVRVVPATTGTLLGRTVSAGDLYTVAGALPVRTPSGLGNGTKWVLTRMGSPSGVVATLGGALVYTDAATDLVREVGP